MVEVFSDVLNFSLLLGVVVAFVSAMIQGYSGFGGGLVIVPILAILFGPIEAISITVVAALIGNAMMWPEAVKKAHWQEAAPLSIAVAITIPIALLFLTSADPAIIRRGMGIFVLASAILLMTGWTYPGRRNIFASTTAGALTGSVMGGFGMPAGPFMVIYYLSAPVATAVQRANIVVSVGVAVSFLLGGLIVNGAYHETTIARTIVIVPIFIVGVWFGQRLFKIAPADWFKKITFSILIVTGISILIV